MKHLYSLVLILTLACLTACTTTKETVTAGLTNPAAFAAVHDTLKANNTPVKLAAYVQEHGYFDLVARDASGTVKWEEHDVPNALANEGEYMIEDVIFRGNTAPTGYYLRLYNTTPTLTSTLSTLSASEPATANGYAPASQGITRDSTGWPLVPQLVSSHYEITSKTVTITATGTVGPVTYAALSTTSDNTGKLVAYAALAATRTLASGDSLQITYKIRLQ